MRWIYLSPHFDDAVLSCGGLIWEQSHQGLPVEIWTVFAGEPPPGQLSEFAKFNYELWGVPAGDEIVAMRRVEDQDAARIVGADLVHFDILDCIYRRSPKGEYLYTETVNTAPHPGDRKLPARIAAALRSELRKGDILVCPLTLGGHVDHILARQAAESLGQLLWYYADVPYLLHQPETLAPSVAEMLSEHFGISAEGLEAWLEGVSAYRSQVDSLYKGEETLFEAIPTYWQARLGIRLWRNPRFPIKSA